MKIWMHDINTPTYRIIKLNCEAHSDFSYLGDLNDSEIETFFTKVSKKIDIENNLKKLHYYGYLHLFITPEKSAS